MQTNEYHVVMEIDPRYARYPSSLRDIYIATSGGGASGTQQSNAPSGTVTAGNAAPSARATSTSAAAATNANNNSARNAAINALANAGKGDTSSGAAISTAMEPMVPLAALSHYNAGNAPLSVSHQGLFVASTISFNLLPGATIGDAATEIDNAIKQIRMPASIYGSLAGTAQVFARSLADEPILIVAAIATVYILLGMLYESYFHPITILSTLPSAGLGAILALMLFHIEFSIIGLIGRDPAHRHRQEERYPYDRFRHRGKAVAESELLRCDLPGLPVALPADHDDHHSRDPRRDPAGDELRQRRRNSPAAGDFDRGRAPDQPAAHALHYASRLSVSGAAERGVAAGTTVVVAGPIRRASGRLKNHSSRSETHGTH